MQQFVLSRSQWVSFAWKQFAGRGLRIKQAPMGSIDCPAAGRSM
jgi:hypothetical protein